VEVNVMNKKTLLSAAIAGALVTGVMTPVHAAPILWYDSFGGFVENTTHVNAPGGVVFSGDRDIHDSHNATLGDGDDAWTEVSWGTPTGTAGPYSGRSGIRLEGFQDQSVDVASSIFVEFGDLVHHNEPITAAGGNLTGIDVSWNLHLYETQADAISGDLADTIFDWHATFPLDIWETSNSGTCDPGAATSPAGTVVGTGPNGNDFVSNGVSVSQCDDAFAFGGASTNSAFNYLGEDYIIALGGFYDNVGALTETFWSPEGSENIGFVRFDIQTAPVPEPATLALIGLGLAGLGFSARRRIQKNV